MMNDKQIIRRRVVLVLGAFLGLFGLVSLVAVLANRNDSIPTDIVSLPDNSDPATLTVYGFDYIANSSLSNIQSRHIEFELQKFVGERASTISYVTVKANSLSIRSGAESEARFTITTNTGVSYLVIGQYLTTNDMFVEIYTPDRKSRVYQEHFDVDG